MTSNKSHAESSAPSAHASGEGEAAGQAREGSFGEGLSRVDLEALETIAFRTLEPSWAHTIGQAIAELRRLRELERRIAEAPVGEVCEAMLCEESGESCIGQIDVPLEMVGKRVRLLVEPEDLHGK